MKNAYRRMVVFSAVLSGCGAFSTANALQIDDLVVIAANEAAPAAEAAADVPMPEVPMGQQGTEGPSLLPEDSEISSGDIFGAEGGYFHPYLNIFGSFTDNIYNSYEDETDSWMTTVSPGVWFALPRKKVIPVSITPNNTTPGGLQNQLADPDYTDRFMSYALVGADLKWYSEDSDLNDIDWVGEGLLRYNLRGGLSLQAVDRFTSAEDDFDYTVPYRPDQRSRYKTNIFKATADWEITEKFRLQGDYTNFLVDYDEYFDNWRDRSDNAFDLYVYFNVSEKTALFVQYRFLDASYDESTYNDNEQNFYYGGVKWDTTEKLSLLFKAGYQEKEFDLDTRDDYDGMALDVQATYRYSEKTEGKLSIYRDNEESDSYTSSDKTVWGAILNYKQEITEKITGTLDMSYEDAEYSASSTDGIERDEKTFYVRPAIQYMFKEWMQAELSYSFETVSATEDTWEYDTNIIMIGLNFAL